MDPREIANKIKELRLRQNMTLDQLATRAGFTKGYLSRIENSEKAPPLFTLDAVAGALGMDVASLLSGSEHMEEVDIVMVRKDERKQVRRQTDPYQYSYESLAYKKPGKNMEPYIITVGFKRDTEGYSHHGEEFIFVLEGEVEFFYGDRSFLLKEGDSLYFDASVPHSGVSLTDKDAKLLCVIYSYKRL